MTTILEGPPGVSCEPMYRYAPPRATTNGDLAAGVGDDLGFDLDRDQCWFLDAAFGEDEDGLPSSGSACIVGPRQTTGKTATLEVAAVADIVVFDHPLHVWTAHEFATARKAYLDMRARLEAHPDYADRVTYRDSHGEEAIYFELGGAIEFRARSGGSGRGFTTSRITLDEWLFGRDGDLGALVPTLVTMEDAQVRYASSAGMLRSAALRALRDRGRYPEPGEDLTYLEFGAPRRACMFDDCVHKIGTPGCVLDDRSLWWAANSGLWYGRGTEATVLRQRRELPPLEFMREFFTWWEDPGAADAFGPGKWELCAGDPPPAGLPVRALAVAASYDLTRGTISAAGVDEEDVAHGAPLDHRPGTDWMIARAQERQRQYGGVDVVIDGGGPAADLIPKLQEAGVALRILDTGDVLDACAVMWKRVQGRRFRYSKTYDCLQSAAGAAVPRTVGDRWAWGRKQSDSDISALESTTFAVWVAEQAMGESWFSFD